MAGWRFLPMQKSVDTVAKMEVGDIWRRFDKGGVALIV